MLFCKNKCFARKKTKLHLVNTHFLSLEGIPLHCTNYIMLVGNTYYVEAELDVMWGQTYMRKGPAPSLIIVLLDLR
jgi:hypothetical protein